MVKLVRVCRHGAVPLASLAVALALGAGACTLLFDPSRIGPDGDGDPDGGQGPGPGGPLELTRLSPDTVPEGLGTQRPVPVVIEGRNIAQGAEVRLIGPGQDERARPLTVAMDGTLAAFELSIPVLEELTDISTQTIEVEVIQGEETQALTLKVDWLDELVASVYGAPRDFTFVTEDLAPRYSRIEIDRDMSSSGEMPLRLVATAELVLAAGLDASGAPAVINLPGVGGPGGCGGGAQGQNGFCSPGGGLAAMNGTQGGGGGGGHETEGAIGTGAGAGIGGSPTGTAAMVDLRSEQGNGGGGGGNAGAGNAGGGGGGGGVIELASQGTFRIEPGAQVSVRGGEGGTCVGAGANGGGGGGSGGGILLRSFRPIEESTTANILVLDGGQGGTGTACNGQGGPGARGRARVDAPALPSSTASATPYHGAVLDPDTPAIVRTSSITVTVFGQSQGAYAVASDRTAPRMLSLDNQGRGTQSVDLAPGRNRVCALVTPSTMRLGDGENCLDVARVP